jgi:membrane associated rhomboid family serine protease
MRFFALVILSYTALGCAAGINRRKPWFVWLWIPFFVLSLAGSGFGAYCFIQLLDLAGQSGESAGFVGAACLLGALSSIPFLIGLIVSLFMSRTPP